MIQIMLPVSVKATPKCGVAPARYTGAYNGPVEEDDMWIKFFCVEIFDLSSEYDPGFSMSASGRPITAFYGDDSALSDEEYYYDIYLVTSSLVGDSFYFGGDALENKFELVSLDKSINGFGDADPTTKKQYEYWVFNLGPLRLTETEWNPRWSEAPSEFSPGEYYFCTDILIYDDENFAFGTEWLFVLVDDNMDGVDNGDIHSPKTSSASHTPISEPATLLLLGGGLIGVGVLRKKMGKTS